MSQLKWVQLDTNVTPNQGATTSSSSIHRGGPQLRAAAAEAGRRCWRSPRRGSASRRAASWCPRRGLDRRPPDPSVSYGALIGDKPFNVKFTGTAPQKPINRYTLVGSNVPRVDIPDKVAEPTSHAAGALPGMLHGRIVRLRSAPMAPAPSRSASTRARSRTSRRAIVRKGDFVGVVGGARVGRVKAARALKVTWQEARRCRAMPACSSACAPPRPPTR